MEVSLNKIINKINTPKKLATPIPKVVRARPVTFWFALKVTVRKQ